MAWKNFQNGYPLYASELNNYLMNQAVATFASSAERASVLTSPVEGQVTWLQDTNAFQVYNGSAWVDINDNTDAIQKSLLTTQGDLIVASGANTPARLGIGTNGQVLSSNGTTATWTTISAGGGETLLSTTTLSGTSTVINSISQSYKKLYLIITKPTIDSGNQTIKINPNGSSILTFYTGTINQGGTNYLTGDSDWAVSMTTQTTSDYSFAYEIDNYTSTTSYKPIRAWGGSGASGWTVYNWAGYFKSNSAITSITLQNSSGGTMTGGTARLYGVN